MEVAQTTRPESRFQVLSALKHRNYRLYWMGSLVSIIGFAIMMLAQSWLVYDLTGSPLYLGLVGLATSVPTIAFTLFGGVLADRIDRRRLLILTQAASGAAIFVLATLTATGLIQVWHILAIAAVIGAIQAFDLPARQAMVPSLVERKDLMNGIALTSTVWQASRIVGPTVAGLLIGLAGIATCFYVTAFGYLVMIFALTKMQMEKTEMAASRQGMVRNLGEGLGFIRNSPVFYSLIGMTFFNSLFGMSYVTLMPVFAKDILQVGSQGLGLLMSASGVGALIGTFSVASLGDIRRKGYLLVGGATIFGTLLALFGLTQWLLVSQGGLVDAPPSPSVLGLSWWFLVSLGLLAFSGITNAFYMTTTMTLLQALVPDALRGRVMGVYGLTWSLMPLGGMQAGAAANFIGAPAAVMLAGLLVAVFALLVGAKLPHIRNL